MSRIAALGSGIAGLAAAWLLSRRHDVDLFERAPRLGGHTHTHLIDRPRGRVAPDTGFLVRNDRTCPNLIRLFRERHISNVQLVLTRAYHDRTYFGEPWRRSAEAAHAPSWSACVLPFDSYRTPPG